ncbi:MAG: hypothetical protein ACPG32_10835 [Akkermansiaceae bacterium]
MKTKTMKPITNLLFTLVLITTASCQEVRTVKITVTEEDGAPIEGANTIVTFLGYRGEDTVRKKGLTNAQGISKTRGATSGRMSTKIEKEGYYASRSGRLSRNKDHDLTYVLRKIKKPIPMYVRKFRGRIPMAGKACGFDFEVGDWVAPHGLGKRIDMLIKGNKEVKTRNDWKGEVTLSFPNKHDGIQKDDKWFDYSEFKSSRKAPLEGYLPDEQLLSKQHPKNGYKGSSLPKNYLVRTRSQVNSKGEIVTAFYSKIIGGVEVIVGLHKDSRKSPPSVAFTYYFNPTPNDRNLEFDPKRNLFKNLDSTEQVHEP